MLVSLHDVTVGEPGHDLLLVGFESTLGNVRTGDANLPLGHGARPGADYLEAGTITLTLRTDYPIRTRAAADAATAAFTRAWRASLSLPPGETTELRIQTGERTLVLHGRAGRLSPPAPDSILARQGLIEIIAEFRVLDPLAYSATSDTLSLSVVPQSLGGIIAPITTPVTTTMTSGVEYRMLTVGGIAPAPLRVTFHGPARDPKISVGGAEIGVVGTLAYDEDLTVDGRTKTAALADGTPAGHRLSRASRLDLLRVEPGTHEVAFTATDRTGTAHATVEATPSYYHL